jgi:hypothetical protein
MTDRQGGLQLAGNEKVRKGKMERNKSSTITTHIYIYIYIYISRTGNGERMDREKGGNKRRYEYIKHC